MKKIFLLGILTVILFAKINPLMTQGEAITDIGNAHSQYIEVPLERISYTPNIQFVNNVLVYSDRVITAANCDVDLLKHESCPLDRTECAATLEYTNGRSTAGTGIIPCSVLHPSAYWDGNLGKCVLTGSNAGLCPVGFSFNYANQNCVKTTDTTPTASPQTYTVTINNAEESGKLDFAYRRVARLNGATYVNTEYVYPYPQYSPTYYFNQLYGYIKYSSNHSNAFTIKQTSLNPERHFYGHLLPRTSVTTELMVSSADFVSWHFGFLANSTRYSSDVSPKISLNGNADNSPHIHNYPLAVDFNYNKISCNNGGILTYINGTTICRTTTTTSPQCNKAYFPTYSNGQCLGDRKYYTYYTYQCPLDANAYGNKYGVINAGGDCGALNLKYDTNNDGIKDHCNYQTPPTNNCKRVNYVCPLDSTKICTEGVKTGGNATIERDNFELLVNPAQFSGDYKQLEFGQMRDYECTSNLNKDCPQALSTIYGKGNELCFKNRSNQEGCFKAEAIDRQCVFEGFVNEDGIKELPIFSFLNSPDEVVEQGVGKEDNDSPTRISLSFTDYVREAYKLKQIKTTAKPGENITVDFWLYWDGSSTGIPISFGSYTLWLRQASDGKWTIGFNTYQSEVYGITDASFLAGGWHRITAVFTHGDSHQNQLYIDGSKRGLSHRDTGHTYAEQKNADITQILQLSGGYDSAHALGGKIAGLNIYNGELNGNVINAMYNKGGLYGTAGITGISATGNSIDAYNGFGAKLGTIQSNCQVSGKVGRYGIPDNVASPMIIAAKATDGRIGFWDSYMKRGDIGFIEINKHVNESSYANGYRHEHADVEALRAKGFTAFTSPGDNKTYGVMGNQSSYSSCIGSLSGTAFVPAEITKDTTLSASTIKMLSFYMDASHGKNCIIVTQGNKDNKNSTWAKKRVTEKGTSAYYCSPWSCIGHQCGYAECPTNFIGTSLKPEDLHKLTTATCIQQKCDKNYGYFRYCGTPFGCDQNDYTITKTDSGQCKKATCNGDDLFSATTGTCEKIDCKYIKMDGKCYKKTY